jgi:hypothetical protein
MSENHSGYGERLSSGAKTLTPSASTSPAGRERGIG